MGRYYQLALYCQLALDYRKRGHCLVLVYTCFSPKQKKGTDLFKEQKKGTDLFKEEKARKKGVPDTSVRRNPNKYLIETNPVLTDLKQFMSSDYLLTNLGYDPDIAAKRLGDGFFEQRMIQQAVVERTGQRFIDGQTSDEAMFKYLMNNAIASKDELNLSVGVTLTAQQVAA